ncbi:MAG: GGDEF domain-containing protein [Calditrichota bacterium]
MWQPKRLKQDRLPSTSKSSKVSFRILEDRSKTERIISWFYEHILFAAALFIHLDFFLKWYKALIHFYPYAVYLVGILLGWRFNRSRLLFAILVLLISDQVLLHFSALIAKNLNPHHLIVNVLSILLPLNLLLLSVIKERGILTLKGIGRMGLILIQPVIIYALILSNDIKIFKILDLSILNISGLNYFNLSQIGLLIFFIIAIFLLIRYVLRKGILDSGFFWALIASLMALNITGPAKASTFYFATAGLILVVSVLELSFLMAFRDELTGLPGRRALQENFLKLGSTYTIAMVDIDHFKKFNDRHGHDVGDQVLRMVAAKLAKVAGGGKAFRYGGEEFTIIFSGIRSTKRPRKKPENLKSVPKSDKKVTIKVSIGMAERGDRYPTPYEVVKAADQALYRAKNSGRNCLRTMAKSSR